jgi:hypothetical protein
MQRVSKPFDEWAAKSREQSRLEQSRQSSPASLPATHDAGDDNHQPATSPSPPKAKSQAKVEVPLHERLAKDSRPDAEAKKVANGQGGSLCWWSSSNNRGSL